MLQLLLTLLDYEGDDDARDECQGNGGDDSKVNRLARGDTAREDIEYREGGSCHRESNVFVNGLEDGLVHILLEVWHRLLRGGVYEHIDLEIIGVLIHLVELPATKSVGLRITVVLGGIVGRIELLVRNIFIVIV